MPNATCRVCGTDCPKGRRTICSDTCKAVAEVSRARNRYLSDREAWIARSAKRKSENRERSRELARAYAKRHAIRISEYSAIYRAEHPELYRTAQRRWYAAQGDRSRELGRLYAQVRRARIARAGVFKVTAGDLARTLARFGNACAYCSRTLTDVQWDHVLPLARGGRHSIGNLVPSCASCNRHKHARLLSVWRYSRTA